MSLFESFVSVCERFRRAGEINGCLAEAIAAEVSRREDLSARCGEAILREVRDVLVDARRDRDEFDALVAKLLRDASVWPVPVSRGPAFKWLPCRRRRGTKRCVEVVPPRRERKEFRDGEKARHEMLQMIDVMELGLTQVRELQRARDLHWSPQKTRDRAREALAHWRFEDGCYARATFDFLARSIEKLKKAHRKAAEEVALEDIRGVVRSRMTTGEGLTLYGRFGWITRSALETMNTDEVETTMDAGTPSRQGLARFELWDSIEAAVRRLPAEAQDVVRSVLAEVDGGTPLKQAFENVAASRGTSAGAVKDIFRSFQQIMLDER